MTTFSAAFRSEVVRMARKELKPELQGMRKSLTAHRSEIAALKREVKALTSQLKSAQRISKTSNQPEEDTSESKPQKRARGEFRGEALVEKRAQLGITQKDMARLLQVSSLSVYKWERGQTHPRAAQLERIAEVLKLGKRKALAALSQE